MIPTRIGFIGFNSLTALQQTLALLALITLLLNASSRAQTEDSARRESLINLERQSWEAWKTRNAEFFKDFLSDDHVEVGFYGLANKDQVLATVATPACKVESYSIDQFNVTMLDANTALLTYHAAQETTCNGKTVPSPVWVSSLYKKRGDRWLNVFYQQTQTTK
jgi:hypothetical protein